MIRIGQGYDLHRIQADRALILAGVSIPWERGGLAGHSDADVLVHAVIDALLGALALGDIGQWFPDTDPAYRGISSLELLRRICAAPGFADWRLENLDATVLAEAPRLASHIPAMRRELAGIFEVEIGRISIKAKTGERVGVIGRGEAMAAQAVVLLVRES